MEKPKKESSTLENFCRVVPVQEEFVSIQGRYRAVAGVKGICVLVDSTPGVEEELVGDRLAAPVTPQ